MAKGYWIGHVDISDPGAYAAYVAGNNEILPKYGGRFIVRGGEMQIVEGAMRGRHVVIEFPSYAQALAAYNSPEYRENMKIRLPAGEADLTIVEGYDG
ncbi:DUF1330 domain-containing protein [Rhodovulum sp. DZ06]|uniref:DUF1330 domain-containing protein n=1 Tax=Rhodovulum sp. DZ06 TaxID=3425126 RepID=UPI003D358859